MAPLACPFSAIFQLIHSRVIYSENVILLFLGNPIRFPFDICLGCYWLCAIQHGASYSAATSTTDSATTSKIKRPIMIYFITKKINNNQIVSSSPAGIISIYFYLFVLICIDLYFWLRFVEMWVVEVTANLAARCCGAAWPFVIISKRRWPLATCSNWNSMAVAKWSVSAIQVIISTFPPFVLPGSSWFLWSLWWLCVHLARANRKSPDKLNWPTGGAKSRPFVTGAIFFPPQFIVTF